MDNGGFNYGDIECGRSYPLILNAGGTVAAELAQIPGYATANAAAIAAFDRAPLGTTWTMLSSVLGGATYAVLPIGSTFRKLNNLTWANGGRITRVINPTIDRIVPANLADTFITNLAITNGADTVQVTGITLGGNGVAALGAPVKAWIGGLAGAATAPLASVAVGTTLQSSSNNTVALALGGGMAVILSSVINGAFDFTFTYGVGGAGPVPLTIEYMGLIVDMIANPT